MGSVRHTASHGNLDDKDNDEGDQEEQRLPHPPLLTGFPLNLAVRFLAPGDIRATASQVAAFREFAEAADPLADAVVEAMRRLPAGQGRRMFELAVEQGIDALEDPPEAFGEFFAQVEQDPYWLDRDRLETAAWAIIRAGPFGALTLGSLGLLGGYLAFRGVKPLVATGDLETMAPRRLAETTRWWLDVTSPGGLDRRGAGYTGTVRVRIMHAQVRAAMNRRAEWDHGAWGHPINQIHLAGTHILFSHVYLVGTRMLGVWLSARERADVLHLWRYVGWLIGIDPRLLPVTEADCWRMWWLQIATEYGPDDDSRQLAQAFMAAIGPLTVPGEGRLAKLTGRVITNYATSYSRLAFGSHNSDLLGLPDRKLFQAAVVATAGLVTALHTIRRAVPGTTRIIERAAVRGRTQAIKQMDAAQHGDTTYARHDRLTVAAQQPTGTG